MTQPKEVSNMPIEVQIELLEKRIATAETEYGTIKRYPAQFRLDYDKRCKGFETAIEKLKKELFDLKSIQKFNPDDFFNKVKDSIEKLNSERQYYQNAKYNIVRKAQAKAIRANEFDLCRKLGKLLY